MRQPEFIRLEHSLEKAMTYRSGSQMNIFSFKGVQLIPFQDAPYIQRTHNPDGMEIEDPQVILFDICGRELQNLTTSFSIVSVFQDLNGVPQLEWSLSNIGFDAGLRLVYLRIQQGANDFIYSTPFVLSAFRADYVSRWDYRNNPLETMLSTGLVFYFKQTDDLQEIGTYDTVYTGRRTTVTTKLVPFEVWHTGIVDIHLFRLIKQMLRNRYIYSDFAKTGLFEAFETPRLEADENFSEQEILLVRDETDIYDPFYVPPIPPDPPVVRSITLSMGYFSNTRINFIFEYENIDSPGTFIYQYSLDQVTWVNGAGSAVSPQDVEVANYQELDYFYRIWYPTTDTYSNIAQYNRAIIINNITGTGPFNPNGNKYYVYYTLVNFTTQPYTNLRFEVSIDGENWQIANYSIGNQNPKLFSTPGSSVEFKYFRVLYEPYGIKSDPYFFDF